MLVQKISELPSKVPKLISVDTETVYGTYDMEGYSIAFVNEDRKIESYFVPVGYEMEPDEDFVNVDKTKACEYLKKLCAGRRVVFHNAAFDLCVLEHQGIDIEDGMYEDTMLLHWVLDTERRHGLKKIMEIEYGRTVIEYKEARKSGFEIFANYADNDARYTIALFYRLCIEAKKFPKTWGLYKQYELPFVRLIKHMSYDFNYIRIDRDLLSQYKKNLEGEMNIVTGILKDKLGDINFNSNPQLGKALFEKGIPVKRKDPTEGMKQRAKEKGEEAVGNYTLGEKELLQLKKHGLIIELILYNRHLEKLYGTYISPIYDKLIEKEKGVWVYSGYDFNQIGARTGRLGSNMQQFPRDVDYLRCHILADIVKDSMIKGYPLFVNDDVFQPYLNAVLNYDKLSDAEKVGVDKLKLSPKQKSQLKKSTDKYVIDIRALFIAMPGCVFVDADLSQIELRTIAHLAKDKVMCEAFTNGEDLHSQTAERVSALAKMKVTRQDAKPINFGLVYGLTAYGLKRGLNISMRDAEKMLNAYFQVYSGIKNFIDDTHVSAAKSHYVQTVLGRRRNIHTLGINDRPELARTQEERRKIYARINGAQNSAVSTIVQGSAADILKISMINLYNDYIAKGTFRIVLQVHDELLVECKEKDGEKILSTVKEYMETSYPLSIPVLAEAKIGRTWRSAH